MAYRKSFKTQEEWLTYQRNYRNANRERIREINKKWRDKQKNKWDHRNPIARAAHKMVNNALTNGTLKRKPCEVCGTKKDNRAHHDDYNKPLKVRWLCEKHHREHHNSLSTVRDLLE